MPTELRNKIYKFSGTLESKQFADLDFGDDGCLDADYHDVDSGGCEFCSLCIKDGCACYMCLFMSWETEHRSIWVNRNSRYATSGHKTSKNTQLLRSNTTLNGRFAQSASVHGAHISRGVEQPVLTKVCKKVRSDTLPIFYGDNSFLFTIFDRKTDIASLFKWLRIIGPQNARSLNRLRIVTRNKRDTKYVKNELVPMLAKLGVREENSDGEEVADVTKLGYPFCFCEHCIRMTLGN